MLDDAYKQGRQDAVLKMRAIVEEMRETAIAVMNPDWEYACDRFLGQLKNIQL